MGKCEFCGRQIPEGSRRVKFCSEECLAREEARRKRELRAAQGLETVVCRFNSGVDCPGGSECTGCGWHPAVAEKRLEAFRSAWKG